MFAQSTCIVQNRSKELSLSFCIVTHATRTYQQRQKMEIAVLALSTLCCHGIYSRKCTPQAKEGGGLRLGTVFRGVHQFPVAPNESTVGSELDKNKRQNASRRPAFGDRRNCARNVNDERCDDNSYDADWPLVVANASHHRRILGISKAMLHREARELTEL